MIQYILLKRIGRLCSNVKCLNELNISMTISTATSSLRQGSSYKTSVAFSGTSSQPRRQQTGLKKHLVIGEVSANSKSIGSKNVSNEKPNAKSKLTKDNLLNIKKTTNKCGQSSVPKRKRKSSLTKSKLNADGNYCAKRIPRSDSPNSDISVGPPKDSTERITLPRDGTIERSASDTSTRLEISTNTMGLEDLHEVSDEEENKSVDLIREQSKFAVRKSEREDIIGSQIPNGRNTKKKEGTSSEKTREPKVEQREVPPSEEPPSEDTSVSGSTSSEEDDEGPDDTLATDGGRGMPHQQHIRPTEKKTLVRGVVKEGYTADYERQISQLLSTDQLRDLGSNVEIDPHLMSKITNTVNTRKKEIDEYRRIIGDRDVIKRQPDLANIAKIKTDYQEARESLNIFGEKYVDAFDEDDAAFEDADIFLQALGLTEKKPKKKKRAPKVAETPVTAEKAGEVVKPGRALPPRKGVTPPAARPSRATKPRPAAAPTAAPPPPTGFRPPAAGPSRAPPKLPAAARTGAPAGVRPPSAGPSRAPLVPPASAPRSRPPSVLSKVSHQEEAAVVILGLDGPSLKDNSSHKKKMPPKK